MKLIQKTIVITGGTSGIGLHLARTLSVNNNVIVIARPSRRLDCLAQMNQSLSVYPADLSDPNEYEQAVDFIVKKHKKIDVLINNAAVQHTATFLDDDFDYDTIKPEIHLNFTAICALSYLFLPALLSNQHQSLIVNINSGLSLAPKTNSAVYCATKAAMNAFSQSLSYQLEDTNVDVVQAFLPVVDTPMTLGRGSNKMPAKEASSKIITGIENGKAAIDVGKVKILRLLFTLAPPLARKLMRRF